MLKVTLKHHRMQPFNLTSRFVDVEYITPEGIPRFRQFTLQKVGSHYELSTSGVVLLRKPKAKDIRQYLERLTFDEVVALHETEESHHA